MEHCREAFFAFGNRPLSIAFVELGKSAQEDSHKAKERKAFDLVDR